MAPEKTSYIHIHFQICRKHKTKFLIQCVLKIVYINNNVLIICITVLIILNNKHRIYKNNYWHRSKIFFIYPINIRLNISYLWLLNYFIMLQCFTSNKKYKSKSNNRGELFKEKTLIAYVIIKY